MVKDKAIRSGSSVVANSLLTEEYEIQYAKDQNKTWYRSKEKKGGMNPFTSYMMNKKWILEEEFNTHMLRFQQVTVKVLVFIKVNYVLTFQAGLVNNEVPFKAEVPDSEPEPLRLEHFYFPLGLWLAGLVVSVICLLAEIIIKE